MRKEPFFVGDIVHVFNRGNRKQEIVRDDRDRWHFLQALYYFNDEYEPHRLFRELYDIWGRDSHTRIDRPGTWPSRQPIVDVLAFTLMDNHYHLILQETRDGGVTKFMRKIGTSMTNRFNTRHKETGRLFQGPYKARRVDDDNYLRYLNVYVHIKNVCELYKGGIAGALRNFDDAFLFAVSYPYGSLGGYAGNGVQAQKIISPGMLKDQFAKNMEFKEFARNCLEYMHFDERAHIVSFDDAENNAR